MCASQSDIRRIILAKRNQLSKADQQKFAVTITNHLIYSDFFQSSHHIACYIKMGSEVDTQPMMEAIFSQHKQCYLPVIDPKQYGKMYFLPYQEGEALIESRFHIPEPIFDEKKVMQPDQLDLVLLPLCAFDAKGSRIGTGGGYYDRAFQSIKQKALLHRPILCGLAYALQEIDHVVLNEWDITLDFVVTECGLKNVSKSHRYTRTKSISRSSRSTRAT